MMLVGWCTKEVGTIEAIVLLLIIHHHTRTEAHNTFDDE
jgi:hypothetical protein